MSSLDDYFNRQRDSILAERASWQRQADAEGVSISVIQQRVFDAEQLQRNAAFRQQQDDAAARWRAVAAERTEARQTAQAREDAAAAHKAAVLAAQQSFWAAVARGETPPRTTWGR